MAERDPAPGRSGPSSAPGSGLSPARGRSGPSRRSPLQHYADRLAEASGPRVRITEVPFLTQLAVRVDVKSPGFDEVTRLLGFGLPVEPNTVAGDLALWLGPDEWLVVGADEARAAAARAWGAIVDVSGQRTVIELAGPRATDVLAKGCALDLHPRVFGPGQCAQTLYAKAPIILLPRGDDTYWLLVRSSYAEYLAEYLIDAMSEYRRVSDS